MRLGTTIRGRIGGYRTSKGVHFIEIIVTDATNVERDNHVRQGAEVVIVTEATPDD